MCQSVFKNMTVNFITILLGFVLFLDGYAQGDTKLPHGTDNPQNNGHPVSHARGAPWQMYGSAAMRQQGTPPHNLQRQNSRGGTHQPVPFPYGNGKIGRIYPPPIPHRGPPLPPGQEPNPHENHQNPRLRTSAAVHPDYDPLFNPAAPPVVTMQDPEGGGYSAKTSDSSNGGVETDSSSYHQCGGECRGGEFLCSSSCTCIPTSWRCDGEPDCVADDDEADCGQDGNGECLTEEGNVECPRTGRCIKKEWLCDGDDDCGDFSDETHCGSSENCTSTEFECANGLCIQTSWLCDGDNDCKDYSDETNCSKKMDCTEHEFRCSDGSCVSLSWKCDFEPDCSDGSDEAECQVEVPACTESEFKCAYPRCVRLEFRCDGDDDCGDWSDEDDCPIVPDGSCSKGEFRCNSGKCISEKWRCDDERDCESGEDEESCAQTVTRTCGPDEYVCRAGNCILKTWVCDGVQDCAQGEDENGCIVTCDADTQFACNAVNDSSPVTSSRSARTLPSHTARSSVPCIHKKHVCDGKSDCPRGEDERNCSKKKPCDATSRCQQTCVITADGHDGCSCYPGYTLHADGFRCQDIDECAIEMDPVCSQTCNNTVGSFVCGCSKGYVLRPDGRTCKALGAPPTLLFANRIDIRQVSLNNLKYTAILKGLHNAIALDFHYRKGFIFWSDISMDVVRTARLNGTQAEDVIRWGLESPGGVAVDWIHDLIFWTDSGTRRVEVATLDGKIRHVLVSNDLDKPRAIAVHPGEALVFWTDWGPNPKIERIEMDGKNRKSIITESIIWPNGLTIDYTANRIYWADAKHHVIESSKLDGMERRKVVTKGLPHPFALTLFEDSIYWTDWHTKSISTANKATGSGFRTIHSGLHFPMDIHSYHPQRQPNYTNHCGDDNGGCSHLCLPNRHNYQCVCPLGLKLSNNKRTCDSTPDQLLLFARKKDIRLRRLDTKDESNDMVLPVDGVKSAVAIAWDSNTDSIFWSDVEADLISRAFLNGSKQQVVIGNNLESPAGLAVDWVTDKLYWTDAGTKHIEVSNLNGSMRSLLIWDGLDKPRDIAVDPVGGYMYWSDWGTVAKIERAGMDGSQRIALVTANLTWPNGLAIDHDKGRLYWADGGTKSIEYVTLDGKQRTVLINTELYHPFGLTVFSNKIIWTDWTTASIHVANKDTGGERGVLRSGISHLMDVRVFHRNRQPLPSSCHAHNGGCSHLCLLAPLPAGYSCACPIGIKMLKNGKTCAPGPTNSLIIAHRVDIRQISLDVPYTVDVVLPLPHLKSAMAVDVDRKTGEIFWTDTDLDIIQKALPDGSGLETVIYEGLVTVDGIVVDSTGRKIYWTDAGRNSIEVAELDGSSRKVLIWSNLDNPRAITLHYHLGLMYWSDWGEKAKIEQADMDGNNRKTLISENLKWPNGLAIDRPSERLYWNDGMRKTIESSDLNGKDRHVIVSDVPHPYGLVIVGSHMYWTDWKTEALHRADKNNGTDRVIIRNKLEGLMDIRSVQTDNVEENACGENNGGCSHLCLRSPQGYTCACPTGILLQADHKTCDPQPNAYLLYATKSALSRVSLDTEELWDVTLPISGIINAIAVDYHWNKSLIVYTDVSLDVIRTVGMFNFSNTQVILSTNLSTPDGLVVDWISDNIYWTDTGRKVLEVARLDGSCRKIIIHSQLDEPRAIAVYPRKGYLFWTDWGESPKIERAMLDGSKRKEIITNDLEFPNGLAIDFEDKKLYWADALKDRIEMANLNGHNRVALVPELTHPFGLTQFGDHIYWTDWYKKAIERADKMTGRNRIAIRTELHGVMEIRAVAAERQTGWNPCAENNGYCSHLCLFRGKDYLCACPDVPDDTSCFKEPAMRVALRQSVEDCPDDDMDDCLLTNSVSDTSGGAPMLLILGGICLCVVIIILAVLIGALMYHKKRRRTKKYLYAGSRSVLTFSNPNYNASTSDVGHSSDKRSLFWRRMKYDKSQERVYDVHSESDKQTASPEVVSLIPAPPSPSIADRHPSPCHEGVDNPSMKAG